MGKVRNEDGKVTQAKILVDSGNLTRCGVAISEPFRKKMGLKLAIKGRKKISTAGAGLPMTQTGVSRAFDLRIPGIRETFRVRKAVVVEELTDEVNVGTRFLQEVEAVTGRSPSLRFHANGTSLSLGEDSVELVNRIGRADKPPPPPPLEAVRRFPGGDPDLDKLYEDLKLDDNELLRQHPVRH